MRCNERNFLREEILERQAKELCQKVSLPDEWRDKYLAKLGEWEKENHHSSDIFVQNLRVSISTIKAKIDRLMDGYLDGGFELSEFQEKKNALMSEKKTLEEKLADFERKGNHWLELTRNWILLSNHALNLASGEKFGEIKTFLKSIGSNPRLASKTLLLDFRKPFSYLTELPLTARSADAFFPSDSICWSILQKVRTFYEQNPDSE